MANEISRRGGGRAVRKTAVSPEPAAEAMMTPLVSQPPLEGVTVGGDATGVARPDTVEITLELHAMAPTATQAARDSTGRMTQFTQAIASLGVSLADVQSGPPIVFPVYPPALGLPAQALPQIPAPALVSYPSGAGQPAPGEVSQPIGYHAVTLVKLSVKDLTRLGEVLDAALRMGAALAARPWFRVRDESSLRRSLLEAAAREARGKAEALAKVFGRELGDAIWAFEDVQPAYYGAAGPLNGGGVRMGVPAFAMPPVGPISQAPGEFMYHARVNVTYRLQ